MIYNDEMLITFVIWQVTITLMFNTSNNILIDNSPPDGTTDKDFRTIKLKCLIVQV